MSSSDEDTDTAGAKLISNIVTNSIELVAKDNNIGDRPVTNITVDAEIKNGGLITVDVRVGYKGSDY